MRERGRSLDDAGTLDGYHVGGDEDGRVAELRHARRTRVGHKERDHPGPVSSSPLSTCDMPASRMIVAHSLAERGETVLHFGVRVRQALRAVCPAAQGRMPGRRVKALEDGAVNHFAVFVVAHAGLQGGHVLRPGRSGLWLSDRSKTNVRRLMPGPAGIATCVA